jgi:redox-sensitive bicupin YhaK (pirin superfamily)
MSNLAASPEFELLPGEVARSVLLNPRIVKLTPRSGISIRRTLPHRDVKFIGAWCFVDHYGPTNQVQAMQVAAHPHTGLQTVTWLFSGEVEHRDSAGNVQRINPGELNIMTSGNGIAHSELSLASESDLHGIQLWVALPANVRSIDPAFDHFGKLPEIETESYSAKIFIGELFGLTAPARSYSQLVGAELNFTNFTSEIIELKPEFEYGILVIDGEVKVRGSEIPVGSLLYLGIENQQIEISAAAGSRLILLGGEPFSEPIIMWWNFIGRSHEEIVQMREDWELGTARFGKFEDEIGGRIPAPPMPASRLISRSGNTQSRSRD